MKRMEVLGLGKDDWLALLCLEVFALGIQYLKSVISLLLMILFNNFKENTCTPYTQIIFQAQNFQV